VSSIPLGPLERLGVVDDEVYRFALAIEPAELLQGDGLEDFRFVPVAAPEELPVVGAMGVGAEQTVEPADGVLDPHGHGRHQTPEVRPGGLGEEAALRVKKVGQNAGHCADGHHAVVLLTGNRSPYRYRQETPHFCCPIRVHDENRSV